LRIRKGKEKPVLDPEFFKDCYVFYGSSATALFDLKTTPISKIYPGVEINATFLDNLLSNDFIKDSPAWVTILFTLFFALVAGIAGRMSNSGWQSAILFFVLLPLPFLPGFAAYPRGYWLPIGVQEIAVAISLVGAVLINYALEGR
jgi:adenylate cyclase